MALSLWLGHPWTVRPIAARVDAPSGSGADPTAFVDAMWTPKLVPALLAAAADVRIVLDALQSSAPEAHRRFGRADGSGSWYVVVRGSGRVLSVDRQSSNGVALIDIAPYDGRADLSLQLGPAVRGTALRDATNLVPFSRFSNQLQFADVANALNERSDREVVRPIAPKLVPGTVVAFVAAASDEANEGQRLSGLVPVQLTIEEHRDE
jgi:predicted lipoprotein